ncbi:MAG: hypothetical protein RL410_1509 [Actinomycetota bacterium]|jgi:choline kinase
MGTRLARPLPKPLTELSDGRTIMGQQIDNLKSAFAEDYRLTIVVGFKLEAIIERFPDATFVYNEVYDSTNTSKSLLKALRQSGEGGVLWMNGDVVFDAEILRLVKPHIETDQSFVVVNKSRVADEEVKYTLDATGHINQLSKTVVDGLGEAVGINFISNSAKATLIRHLDAVADQDYFERGLELAIENDGVKVIPVDISSFLAIEVDNSEDLDRVNKLL